MQVLRFGVAVVCLLVWDGFALAAGPAPAGKAEQVPPAGKVEHVPPEEALAVLGSPVTGPDGKEIGRLVDVLVNASGTPEAAVIDVGGFMGVGARKIAVHWSVLHFAPANPKQRITLDLTLDQIKAAPEYGNPRKPAPVVVPAKAPAKPSEATTPPGAASAGAPSAGGTGSGPSATGTAGGPTGGGASGNGTTSAGTTSSGASGNGTTSAGTTSSGASGNGTSHTGTSSSGTTNSGTSGNGTSSSGGTTSNGAASNGVTGGAMPSPPR
jgi:hypothetical protein